MRAKMRRRSAIRWFAAILGAGLATTSSASAQVSPSAAPAEWVQYAEDVTTTIAGWLQAGAPAAIRLRHYLDKTRPAPDQPSPPLALKVWISPEGAVRRIEFTHFARAEINDDLRALIVGRRLAAAPPTRMLQPIRLAIQLDPAEPTSDPAEETPAKST